METYTTDEEQIEAVKRWWRENGLPIALGLVIGLGGIFGWRGYLAYEVAQAEAASDVFQNMTAQMRDKNAEKAREHAQKLLDEYATTPYAVFAAMNLAKLAVEDGDFEGARDHLEYASDHAQGQELRSLARVRLARVIVAEGKPDEALKVLGQGNFGELDNIASELKGDILAAKGDREAASAAYNAALNGVAPDSPAFELLTLKLDSVSL